MAVDIAAAWLVVCLGLSLVGGVVAAGAVPELGRFAPALGLPVALAVVGLVALWVGHLSIAAGLTAGIAVLVLVAAGTARQTDWAGRFWAGRHAYLVFLLAFGFVLGLRALDPAVDPASGEKFLDYGLLRAHLRAQRLPAEDIWFAGEPFSYYYAGQYVLSLVARLAGTPARYAYNLGLATGYAALVTAAYGVAGAIGREFDAGTPAALAAAVLVGLSSNLTTSLRLLVWTLPDPGVVPWLEWVALRPTEFHYWWASRVVPGMITEFPLFAYLNGDLHAHMLSMPFSLLTVAVLYSYTRMPAKKRWRRRLAVVGVVPALAGFVTATNAWSLPILAGLTWLTLYFAPVRPASLLPGRLEDLSRGTTGGVAARARDAAVATGLTALVTALAVGWSLPVWLVSESAGRGLGLLPTRSPLWALLVVHGAFLAVLGPALWRRLPSSGRRRHLAAGAVALAGVATLVRAAGVVVFGTLVAAAWVVLERNRGDGPTDYQTVLALGGFGLVVLVELVYLQEPAAPGRFNTFFKTYAALWVVFAVATGVVLGRVLATRWEVNRPSLPSIDLRPVVVALLVFATLPYAVGATVEWTTYQEPTVRTPSDPTLDALQFAHERYPNRMAAIEWLDARAGTPTLVSAPGTGIVDGYRWVNAPSSLTGLPTVAGWAHEEGYRGRAAYQSRVADVRTMYTGQQPARHRLFRTYDVRYVYYGPIERARYGNVTLGTDPALTVAFENPAVTIYRVDRSAL